MFHLKNIEPLWVQENIEPFTELIFSWNASRPSNGRYRFFVSVKVEGRWSHFMPYATWGSAGQAGSRHEEASFPVRVFQDAVEVLQGKRGEGFQVNVISEGGAEIDSLYGLHVYTNSEKEVPNTSMEKKIILDVKGISQLNLNHLRAKSLCSPTSTTAVLRYLTNERFEPINFAEKVWDSYFDIYGNWVLNVAEITNLLGSKWNGWVERLHGFSQIYCQLQKEIPVVVSVQGPLKGSGASDQNGHLIVVRGYDPTKNEVHCMDPGIPSDEKTAVSFPLQEFMEAWGRRGKIAYMFSKEIK